MKHHIKAIFSILLAILALICYQGVEEISGEGVHIISKSESGIFDAYDDYLTFKEYHDDSAPERMTYHFLGRAYELEYANSARLSASDIRVRNYNVVNYDPIEGYPQSGFWFDEKTGELVSAHYISYPVENLSREAMIEMISSVVGDKIDLSSMTLREETHYSECGENYARGVIVSGFHECDNVTEKLISHDFYYVSLEDEVQIEKRVGAFFGMGQLNIQIIVPYEEVVCGEIDKSVLSKKAKVYLKEHLNPDYEIKELSLGNLQIRRCERKDYLLVDVTLGLKKRNSAHEFVFQEKVVFDLPVD